MIMAACLDSKKLHLLMLAGSSIISSKLFFVFISRDDPEGSNLLIIAGLATALYGLALVTHAFSFRLTDTKRLIVTIFFQIVAVAGLYATLK